MPGQENKPMRFNMQKIRTFVTVHEEKTITKILSDGKFKILFQIVESTGWGYPQTRSVLTRMSYEGKLGYGVNPETGIKSYVMAEFH